MGRPEGAPDVVIKGGRIFVSWNGATEVHTWSLEGTNDAEVADAWVEIDAVKKEGFEESFLLSSAGEEWYEKYRVAALDVEGYNMMYSVVIERDSTMSSFMVWVLVLTWAGFLIAAWKLWKQRRRN